MSTGRVSTATFYKWRAKYGGVDDSMIARCKELKVEKGQKLINAQKLHRAEQRQITLPPIHPGNPQQKLSKAHLTNSAHIQY